MTTNESGYENNLSLYQQMINEITAPDVVYNPPIASLSLESIQSHVAPVQAALSQVQNCLSDYTLAVNARQQAYEQMKARVKSINNLLSLFNVDALFLKDVKSVYDKIMGYTSVSMQGFDHLEENFKALITLLERLPEYLPNNTELTIESLELLADELENKSLAVSAASAALASARNQRNQLMYDTETGIVPIARKVKQYYRALEGTKGTMYQRLVSLLNPMR